MKYAILIALLAAAPCAPVDAAETKKPAENAKKPAPKKKPVPKKPVVRTDMVDEAGISLLKPFDKNSDHQIDIDEFDAVVAEFKKSPKGPLAVFDKGKDGELDALIDRAGMNVKLGAAAVKKAPAAPPAKKKPAPKKPVPPKKPAPPAKPQV